MSEEISQDTKFSPEANGGLMCSEMSDTKPMTAEQLADRVVYYQAHLWREDQPAGVTGSYIAEAQLASLIEDAITQATNAQAEQIATLTEKLDSLKLAADPEDTRYWGISNREAGEIVDDLLLKDAVETATGSLVEQIAALTAENARLRETGKRLCAGAAAVYIAQHPTGDYDPETAIADLDKQSWYTDARQALSAPPADASGLLRLVRAAGETYQEIKSSDSSKWDTLFTAYGFGAVGEAYNALDPAIKAAAERSGK